MRRYGGWTALALAATLCVPFWMAPAIADDQEPRYKIQYEANRETHTITTRDGIARFEIEVWVEPDQPAPVDAQVTVTYTFSDVSSPPPLGWSTPTVSPATAQAIPGRRVEVAVTVGLTENVPEREEYVLVLRIEADPRTAGQVGGPEVQQNSQRDISLTARRALAPSEGASALIAEYRFALMAVGAAVLLAGVVLAKRRRSLRLFCDESTRDLAPGAATEFELIVRSPEPEADRVFLRALDVPPGWDASFDKDAVDVSRRNKATVLFRLEAPATVPIGQQLRLQLAASSRTNPGNEASVPVEVIVVAAAPFSDHVPVPSTPRARRRLELEEPVAPSSPRKLEVDEPTAQKRDIRLELEEPAALKRPVARMPKSPTKKPSQRKSGKKATPRKSTKKPAGKRK